MKYIKINLTGLGVDASKPKVEEKPPIEDAHYEFVCIECDSTLPDGNGFFDFCSEECARKHYIF